MGSFQSKRNANAQNNNPVINQIYLNSQINSSDRVYLNVQINHQSNHPASDEVYLNAQTNGPVYHLSEHVRSISNLTRVLTM